MNIYQKREREREIADSKAVARKVQDEPGKSYCTFKKQGSTQKITETCLK